MKKIHRASLTLVLLTIVGAALVYFCYGPILPLLPQKMVRVGYYQGWLAAWRSACTGRYAYSFDRYLVDGLRDYAFKKDGIATVSVPANSRWPSYYVWGFNDYMEAKLTKTLACDFPDQYVKTYLETGSLDLTQDQPFDCPIHKRAMVVKDIPFEIVFPFTTARPKSDRELAAEAGFPFPESTLKVDASIIMRPRYARTRVCSACTQAEADWVSQTQKSNRAQK